MGNSYRLEQIYDILLKRGTVSVEELAKSFHVTPTTIRRDLLLLEEKKLIYRSRGGASILENAESGVEDIYNDEKIRIAKEAAKFVSSGMSLSLDSGSTIRMLVDQLLCDNRLKNEDLNIVTYSLSVAVAASQEFNVSIPGGAVFTKQDAMLGLEVEEFYAKVSTDIAFIGSVGVYNCDGPTVSYPIQLPVKKAAVNCADKRIVLLGSHKYIRRGIYVVCDWSEVDTLITVQTPENEKQIDRIAQKGVNIILA